MVLSRDAKLYKNAVTLSALGQGIREPILGPCAVTIHWYRSRKSGDLDNRLKILLDALQGIAYQSDAQITELHAYRADAKANPRCEITIAPLPPQEP